MSKKLYFLISFVLLLNLVSSFSVASAATVAYCRFDDQNIPDIDFSEGLASEVAPGKNSLTFCLLNGEHYKG
jgi:hypothetical protein